MNSSIDKLTLELMSNKSCYKKFLSKNEPTKYNELQIHLSKIKKYYSNIIDITENKLNGHTYTNELDDIFDNYVRTCIKYIEMKEYENQPEYKLENEDMMFETIDNNEEPPVILHTGFSYWGKSITKLSSKIQNKQLENKKNIYNNYIDNEEEQSHLIPIENIKVNNTDVSTSMLGFGFPYRKHSIGTHLTNSIRVQPDTHDVVDVDVDIDVCDEYNLTSPPPHPPHPPHPPIVLTTTIPSTNELSETDLIDDYSKPKQKQKIQYIIYTQPPTTTSFFSKRNSFD